MKLSSFAVASNMMILHYFHTLINPFDKIKWKWKSDVCHKTGMEISTCFSHKRFINKFFFHFNVLLCHDLAISYFIDSTAESKGRVVGTFLAMFHTADL